MTKDNDVVYIDRDTYYQIIGEEDIESYKNFLANNPRFQDIDEKRNRRKSVYSENIVLEDNNDVEKLNIKEKKTKLELQHEKDEDYRYFPHRIWLEQHLPRFEMMYGKFFYSKKTPTNKEMCEELLNYYSEVCHIENIEDIKNSSPNVLKSVYEFIQRFKSNEQIKKGRNR